MKRNLHLSHNKGMVGEILCTLGPSSMNDKVIARLEDLGVSLFRVNLSHTKIEDLANVLSFIQNRTSVPVCLDTEGAQVRTGGLANSEIMLEDNAVVRVYRKIISGDSHGFNLYPADIVDRLRIGDFISIDFNSVLAQVIGSDDRGLVLRILTGGLIGENKAVTIERDIDLPSLTEKDKKALAIGSRMGIRHIALSFANQASDVEKIRAVAGKDIFMISKIESLRGVANLEDIAARSDALLLDRGDLSRQVPIEKIPKMQKDIVTRAKEYGTKIYVATNLLESMVKAPTPTRAEVNDIFNTLNDGADGLVLASETAIGSYPIECATMVSKIVREFRDFSNSGSCEVLIDNHSLLLTEPHGGNLVNRVRDDLDPGEIKTYKKLLVDESVLLDAEQIAIGTFSPLEGFMNKEELESVLRDYKMPGGFIWPIPVVLQIKKQEAYGLKRGDKVALVSKYTKDTHAILHLDDIYDYDLDKLSEETFRSNHSDHPGVQLLKRRGSCFLSGKVDLIKRLDSPYKHFEITPRQARAIFEHKGWSRVVGFHTRNVIHRVHEHIQLLAFEKYNCDGLFIHPVVGPKKQGDYKASTILKSYELMTGKYYPKGKVVLGAFQNYSRYLGPREAVFTALCRKNFGCSHFIVGRDHTGVGNYYGPDDAHKLFNKLGDIGIVPIFFNEMHYCDKCKAYADKCEHEDKYRLNISGSEGRRMLKSRTLPPDWFMREDISRIVLDEIQRGSEVFV